MTFDMRMFVPWRLKKCVQVKDLDAALDNLSKASEGLVEAVEGTTNAMERPADD